VTTTANAPNTLQFSPDPHPRRGSTPSRAVSVGEVQQVRMKVIRQRVAPGVLAMLLLATLAGCNRGDSAALGFLTRTEGGSYADVPPGEERIAALRRDIAEYQSAVDETTRRLGRIASYQKLLARELMDTGMYGPALEALQAAMDVQTENTVLYYLAGVAAARHAGAAMSAEERSARLDLAERMYRRSVALQPDHREALFGLAVLLNFELDRPAEALEFIRRLVSINPGDSQAQFLLANILVRTGEPEEALEVYAELAESAPSADQRRQAAENRDALRGTP
jgi:tetratricopeptide (TPR) repeat protein